MAIPLTGILFIAAGISGILAIISYYMKRLYLYRAAANFPGPPALPIIGNAHYFIGNTADILNKTSGLVEAYPSPFRVWLGSRLIIMLHDADHVKTILLSSSAAEKDVLYKFMQPWLGMGLVTASAAKAKDHRKFIIPAFNQKKLDTYVDIFYKHAIILRKEMGKHLDKGEFSIFDYVSLCTLDIICETAMGVSLNAQMGKARRYTDAVTRELEIMYLRMLKVWLHPNFIFNLSKLGKDQRTCLKHLHDVTNDVIHKKQDNLKKTEHMENPTAVPEQNTTTKGLLDILMDSSNDGLQLTDADLRAEVATMVLAGNDTSATTASFTMFVLASYPEIQEKVYEELCKIYGDEVSSDTPIFKEDLDRMHYLGRVMNETMRLFPPIQMLARTPTADIKIGDKILPKGCSLGVPIFNLHRCDKYWSDPLKFDPDRFLPEEVTKRHPYCYIPFSHGARACIGQKYAVMSFKILIATILRRYVLIKDKAVKIRDIKLKADLFLKPAEPLTIRIVERSVGPKQRSTKNI